MTLQAATIAKATHVIEDSSNSFWAVWPTNDADLDHVFYGFQVKRSAGKFVPKANARACLVRKECTRVVAKFN